jgi:hypothetical protein
MNLAKIINIRITLAQTVYLMFLSFIIIFLLNLQLVSIAFAQRNTNLIQYHNPYLGLTVTHPSNWSIVNDFQFGPTIVFEAPRENQSSNLEYLATFKVDIVMPNTTSFFSSSHTSLQKIAVGLVNSTPYRNLYYHIHVTNNGPTILNGNQAYLIEYNFSELRISPPIPIKSVDILTVKGGNLYIISFKSAASKYNDYLPLFEKMTNSLQVKQFEIPPSVLADNTKQYLTYANQSWGMRIQYPSPWSHVEGGYFINDSSGGTDPCFPNIVSFSPTIPDLKEATKVVSVRVNLVEGKHLGPPPYSSLTLEEVTKSAFANYGRQIGGVGPLIHLFWPTYLDFNSTLAGLPAYKLIYFKEGGKYEVLEIGTIVRNGPYEDVYQLNYSSSSSTFLQDLPIIQHMIKSLEIGKPHSTLISYVTNGDLQRISLNTNNTSYTVAHNDCEGVLTP